MAKRESRKETNEFDEKVEASKSFFIKHQRWITWGAGGVLAAIIIGLLLYQFYFAPRSEKADQAVFQAQQYFSNGDYEKALNGDGQNLGFLEVIKKYRCTDAANLAHIYAAACYAQDAKYQEAVDMLEDYKGQGDAMVSPSVIGMMGNCYAELGQKEKAVELLEKVAKKEDNSTLSPIYLIQAGQIYEELGKPEKALDCYKKVKSNYRQSMQSMDIDKYIERLNNQ